MQVFAHRGSSLLWPENTLYAFERAHAAGARGFETDLRLTRDGQIVLCHDATLERLGHPGVAVAAQPASQLTRLTVAAPDGTRQDRILTLQSLLESFPDQDYIFDCKVSEGRLFRTLAQLLAAQRVRGRIWFLPWTRQAEQHLAALFPAAPRFPTYHRSAVWGLASAAGLGRLVEPRNQLVSLPAYHRGLKVLRRAQVVDLHRRGKTTMGYLANTPRDLARCRALGVHAVLTDRVDLVSDSLTASS